MCYADTQQESEWEREREGAEARVYIIFDGNGCAKIPYHMIKSTQPFGEKWNEAHIHFHFDDRYRYVNEGQGRMANRDRE